jgi:hypothetical protein
MFCSATALELRDMVWTSQNMYLCWHGGAASAAHPYRARDGSGTETRRPGRLRKATYFNEFCGLLP